MSKRLRIVALFVVCLFSLSAAAATPQLTILEAEQNKIILTVTTDKPKIGITIENGSKEEVTFDLLVSPLRDPNGQTAAVKIDSNTNTIKIAGKTLQPVTLTADLPANVTYTAKIRFAFAEGIIAGPTLEVTRSTPVSSITVGAIPSLEVKVPLFGKQKKEFCVDVTETGGAEQDLRPVLKSVELKVSDTKSVQDHASLTDSEVEPCKPAVARVTPPKIKARESPPVKLTLQGIRHAGEFKATLAFTDARGVASATSTKDFTIFARESTWLALILIALGVIASALLRIYLTKIRPLMLVEHRVALIFETLDEMQSRFEDTEENEPAINLIKRTRDNVTTRWNVLNKTGRAGGTTEFDVYDDKLQLLDTWLDLFQRRNDVPSALLTDYKARMKAAAQIIDRTSATSADIAAKLADLQSLHAEIDKMPPDKPEAVVDFGDLFVIGKSAEELKKKGAPKSIANRITRHDILAFVVGLLIAFALGWKVLYQPDLTWGGWADYIPALLWGFGMHQFTSGGISTIWAEIRKVVT